MTWHRPDELITHEMLGTFCFQSSDHTQRTHDRTFCQPSVRIFKHFHIRLSAKLNYFRTKIKNCNCKSHLKIGLGFCWQCQPEISWQEEHTTPAPCMCARGSLTIPAGQARPEENPGQEDGKKMPRKAGRETQQRLCCLSSVTLMIPVTILATPHSWSTGHGQKSLNMEPGQDGTSGISWPR